MNCTFRLLHKAKEKIEFEKHDGKLLGSKQVPSIIAVQKERPLYVQLYTI